MRRGLMVVAAAAVVAVVVVPGGQRSDARQDLGAVADCGGRAAPTTGELSWSCVYDDEFDEPLDRSSWTLQDTSTSSYTTGTDDRFACYADDDRVVDVVDGVLRLSLLRLDEPRDCGAGLRSGYLAASVTHHGSLSQTYGRYEVRARLPDLRRPGSQSTFWLWPDDVARYGSQWPDSGEIDFAEAYSAYPDLVVPMMHYRMGPSDPATNRNVYTTHDCSIVPGDFNTYGLEWSPGLLRIEVNGRTCLENHYDAVNAPVGQPAAPFDQPFFLNLTQAMGGAGNAYTDDLPDRLTTEIDYVRIWSLQPV